MQNNNDVTQRYPARSEQAQWGPSPDQQGGAIHPGNPAQYWPSTATQTREQGPVAQNWNQQAAQPPVDPNRPAGQWNQSGSPQPGNPNNPGGQWNQPASQAAVDPNDVTQTERQQPQHSTVGQQQSHPGIHPSQTGNPQSGNPAPPTWGSPAPAPNPMQPPPKRRGLSSNLGMIMLALAFLIIFGTGGFTGWAWSQMSNTNQGTQNDNRTVPTVPPLDGDSVEAVREAVIARVSPTVVQINVSAGQGSGVGSGVIIDERGYIVTNNHVIDGADEITVVLSDGKELEAELVGQSAADDIAVIKIDPPANMVVATLGDSSTLNVGQEVLAIGNPLGITQTVTNGIISALNRTVREENGAIIANAIQTSAPINPGNSGGALVDLQGNVIGIPTLTAIDPEFNSPANGVGFAIPVNRVKQIVPQLIENGKVTRSGRAALGVRAVDVSIASRSRSDLPVDYGVLVTEVIPGGAAEKAGLRENDIIVALDNKEVRNMANLQDELLNYEPGNKIPVRVYRGNQQLTIDVTLGELQLD